MKTLLHIQLAHTENFQFFCFEETFSTDYSIVGELEKMHFLWPKTSRWVRWVDGLIWWVTFDSTWFWTGWKLDVFLLGHFSLIRTVCKWKSLDDTHTLISYCLSYSRPKSLIALDRLKCMRACARASVGSQEGLLCFALHQNGFNQHLGYREGALGGECR